jgi:hypothetical protein
MFDGGKSRIDSASPVTSLVAVLPGEISDHLSGARRIEATARQESWARNARIVQVRLPYRLLFLVVVATWITPHFTRRRYARKRAVKTSPSPPSRRRAAVPPSSASASVVTGEFTTPTSRTTEARRRADQIAIVPPRGICDCRVGITPPSAPLSRGAGGRRRRYFAPFSRGGLDRRAGLAADRLCANVFAGVQLAFDAIRVDDVVILSEWGIEEITLTYVVVHIWDDQRLVLPSTYFAIPVRELDGIPASSARFDLDWQARSVADAAARCDPRRDATGGM